MDFTPISRCFASLAVIAMLLHIALSQTQRPGNLVYFNGSATVTTNSGFNPTTQQITFQFRTCLGGELFSLTEGGQSVSLSINDTGALIVRWNSGLGEESLSLGSMYNMNRWTLVDIGSVSGAVVLSVQDMYGYVAKIVDLPTLAPTNGFVLGTGFTGCIEEVQGIGLSTPFSWASVTWGECPLNDQVDCGPYDPCTSQPCLNNGVCSSDGDLFQCDCPARFDGAICDNDLGPLCSNPSYSLACVNGTCVEDGISNTTLCACEQGFGGQLCDTSSTLCDNNPCNNGGTCQTNADLTGTTCYCAQGYSGSTCDEDVNYCLQNPCLNGGDCQDGVTSYTCTCNGTGYSSTRCNVQDNECTNNPCQNSAACTDTSGLYHCECAGGDAGTNCDQDLCSIESPCLNGATCFANTNTYNCTCVDGFSGDLCETDIDDCVSKPCQNQGICVDGVNGFECFCRQGYVGDFCEFELDECALPEFNICQNGATCIDGQDSVTCQCVPGFTEDDCSVNIDECVSDPCVNNATCQDEINSYQCVCAAGFNGTDCENNIDECTSNPCQNGGNCLDQINGYICDCTDTGFEGTHCENNIDECGSYPCQNNATCQDYVKFFNCSCHGGYEGITCETDISECTSDPCQNGATCLELSNQAMYSNETYSGYLPDEFSYDNAEGYVCVCEPGYNGTFCEVDIDECASSPCQNGATCGDGVNGYVCDCVLGYDGTHCENDINECASDPCENGATCNDEVGLFVCACAAGWGDTQCDVALTGCDGNTQCLNGGTCDPYYENGSQLFRCLCAAGFTGDYCTTDTSSSFRGNEQLLYSLPEADTPFWFSLSFATTIPDGPMIYSEVFSDIFSVQMEEGSMYLTVADGTTSETVSSEGLGANLNDGEWNSVEVVLTSSNVTMTVNSASCTDDQCSVTEEVSFTLGPFSTALFGRSYPFSSDPVSNDYYTGCMRDVLQVTTGDLVMPSSPPGDGEPEGECDRTPQCSPDPCNGRGVCTDLWWTYSCECELGYTGPSCETSFVPATFSFESTTSYAIFDITGYPISSSENVVQLLFRTREADGLLFFTSSGQDYIFLGVDNSTVLAEVSFGGSVAMLRAPKFIADGNYHSLTLTHQTNLSLQVDSSPMEATQLGTSSQPSFEEIFVGGEPDFSDGTLPDVVSGSTYFKGCLWDLKYNNYSLEFFPLDIQDYEIDSIPVATNSNVIEMCNSDNTCVPEPCENEGICSVTWNDFECDCPNGFGGKNCSEETICAQNPCPGGGTCVDRDEGYECVAPATFDGMSGMIVYNNSLNDTRDINTMTLSLRTRRDQCFVMYAFNDQSNYFITLEIQNSNLQVLFDFGNQAGRADINTTYSLADGSWHDISIAFGSQENTVQRRSITSPLEVAITIDSNYTIAEMVETVGGLGDVIHDGTVYLGETDLPNNERFTIYTPFEGNMDEVRIGTFLLPFFNESVYNASNPEQFYAVSITGVTIGSEGEDICNSSPCDNGASCVDEWNEYSCSCVAGFTGTNCETDINECDPDPCVNATICFDMVNGFNCSCTPGFEGVTCAVEIDECSSDPCQNGGTCADLVNGFDCSCVSDFTGRMCEYNISATCMNDPCENGATCTDTPTPAPGKEGFTCACPAGYEGTRCGYEIDYCASVICQNGGTCSSFTDQQDYECQCVAGFEGNLCETNIDDCQSGPCQNGGTCQDGVNEYTCDCVAGYTGDTCETNIDECESNPCYTGVCNDLVDSYTCSCPSGYKGVHCENDTNECETQSPCLNGGLCTNLEGNYSCQCPNYIFGHDCEITPCSPNTCQNGADCSADSPDSVQCNCTLGYVGSTCSAANCSTSDLCLNGGSCGVDSETGRWECSCLEFTEGDRCEFKGPCVDPPCLNGGTCSQTFNDAASTFTFVCACPTGFNDTYCNNEINWCDSNPCQQAGSNCTSDRERFYCACAPGYGGDMCEIKLPDCASGLCQNGASCTDLPYDYECLCAPGYAGGDCDIDIDECAFDFCQNEATCIDLVDDYDCDCTGTGYQGKNCTVDVPECDVADTCLNGATCVEQIGSFTCECAPDYVGTTCESMDPCTSTPCQNGATCTLLSEETLVFSCECASGFTGDRCQTTETSGLEMGLIIGVSVAGGFLVILLLVLLGCFVCTVRKKRATQGSYSPSRQEMTGSFVEMDNVLKMPPEERLI